MLLVKTYVGTSAVHGLGLYAADDVPEGTIMWIFNRHIDKVIRHDELGELPEFVQDYLAKHAWSDSDGHYHIGVDDDKYINHSNNPNAGFLQTHDVIVALRDIAKGEEITEDYSTFSVDKVVLQCMLPESAYE